VSEFYANITLQGPSQENVTAWLDAAGHIAYVSPAERGGVVVFPADLGAAEALSGELSRALACPAFLVLVLGDNVMLYHVYIKGEQTDAYVSPHEELIVGLDDSQEPLPPGNAAVLCAAFDVDLPHQVARVERILRRSNHPTRGYAMAVNRHGELAQALKLPLLAAGTGFAQIEIGELPAAPGCEPVRVLRTGPA
jgi:hypothetical protein